VADPSADRVAGPAGRAVRPGGPAASARTAVVWEVLSSALADADPDARGLDVLDAGGGSGGFAVPLAEAGHRVVVVDPSPDALAALSRRAHERGVSDRVRAVQGDVTDLPSLAELADGVDVVLCHSVLEVVDDPAAALAAVAGCLREGGRLSLLAPGRAAAVLARALAGRPDEAAHVLSDPAGRWGPSDGTSRRWEPAQLSELVAAAGLVVEQVHGVRVVADLVPSAVLDLEPGAAAALLALERALSDRPPFRDLATLLHVLARRPVAHG
jgi:S-adenosylmethionine-dependent methyltransferase